MTGAGGRGRGGSEREAETLRDETSGRLQQGVARRAIAGAGAGRFYSTLVLSALINN